MDNKYFSADKQQKALKWLEEKWPKEKRACEICAKTNWNVNDELFTLIPFNGSNVTIGGRLYPHILITCTSCGNSKFINAVISGISD